LEAIDDSTRVIISGDHKQLPPIGYGNVFSDIIEIMGNNVVSKLTEPMRQAKLSGILTDANMIRNNVSPIGGDFEPKIVRGELKDMYYMFRTNRQSLFDIATKTFLKSVETDGLDNVVIIVPRRQGCINSTQEINKYIQEQLLGDVLEEINYYENSFKLGAKVMQTVNDYQKNVFNGEIGYIVEINTRREGNKNQQYCVVLFTDSDGKEKRVEYTPKELTNLDLAYALTTHKSQGSGYKTVIGIIDNTHYTLLDNCILYTLITRAKKRCLLLAEPQAYLQCIRTSHNRRNTWLSLKKSD
jgi:exodeoxyribonuclease V alpha subunit